MGGVRASNLEYINVLIFYGVRILDTKYRIGLYLYLCLVRDGYCIFHSFSQS